MRIAKKMKKHIIVAFICLLLCISVGYASFAETLEILGTAEGTAVWDVRFTSGGIVSEGNIIPNTGIIDNNSDVRTLTIELIGENQLKYPGDVKRVRAVIKNNSSMPVKRENFTIVNPDNDDITFNCINLNGNAINSGSSYGSGETLAAGESCIYEFEIGWDANSTETSVSGTYSITFDYVQNISVGNSEPLVHKHS